MEQVWVFPLGVNVLINSELGVGLLGAPEIFLARADRFPFSKFLFKALPWSWPAERALPLRSNTICFARLPTFSPRGTFAIVLSKTDFPNLRNHHAFHFSGLDAFLGNGTRDEFSRMAPFLRNGTHDDFCLMLMSEGAAAAPMPVDGVHITSTHLAQNPHLFHAETKCLHQRHWDLRVCFEH